MTTDTRLYTAEELLGMPYDGFRYELVQGELIQMAPAGSQHGRIAFKVAFDLETTVRTHDLGVVYAAETGFKLASNPDTVRAPDVAFVRKDRVQAVGDIVGYWPGAPDLAVEVLSPSDNFSEVEGKVFEWLTAGTQLVLVVNPKKRSITAYRSRSNIRAYTEDETIDAGDVVPH